VNGCKTGGVRRLAVANGPNIFQMLLVLLKSTAAILAATAAMYVVDPTTASTSLAGAAAVSGSGAVSKRLLRHRT